MVFWWEYCCSENQLKSNALQSRHVKHTPPPPKILLMNNDYLKNESISRHHNYCQIQIGIPACVMSSEYFKRTSLYLVRLQIFEWIKFLRAIYIKFRETEMIEIS